MADTAIWDFAVAPPYMAPGVTSMVGYRALAVPEGVHRGMPSSMLTLIVSRGDGVQAADSIEALADSAPAPVILAGLHLQASRVRQGRGHAGVQVAVHPLVARTLFGVPAAELSVTDFDAAPVLGRAGARLHEQVAEAPDWPAAFERIAHYLRDAHRVAPVRPEMAHAWALLARSRGCAPVGAVAQQVSLSPRYLSTLFHREVGHSPKTVAMLMRFEYATECLAAAADGGRVDLAGIAAVAGYADQAHLSRDFVRFTGVSPTGWLAEEFRNIQDGVHAYGPGWNHDHYDHHSHMTRVRPSTRLSTATATNAGSNARIRPRHTALQRQHTR